MAAKIDFEKSKQFQIVLYKPMGWDSLDYYLYNFLALTILGVLIHLTTSGHIVSIIFLIIYSVGLLNSRKLWVLHGIDSQTNFNIAYDLLRRDLEPYQIVVTQESNLVGRFRIRKMFNMNHLGFDDLRRQIVIIFDGRKILVNSAALINNVPNPFGLLSQIYLAWFIILLKFELRKRKIRF